MSTIENTKRIAKNTVILYFRMILVLGVSLYTSRVVLNTLGASDYGIYNVVGGFVIMMGVLNAAMASGTARFLTYELGKKTDRQYNRVFSMSINIHFLIALVIILFAELFGVWFVNTKLVIPVERIDVANWVFQFALFSLFFQVIQAPYSASIISHEKMNVYASISIIEVLLKLCIVIFFVYLPVDKLKLYAFLIFLVSIKIYFINRFYCLKRIPDSHYTYDWDKGLFKRLISFSGWNMFGNLASVVYVQGVNILLNMFLGTVVNAARAISLQVAALSTHFVSSIYTAINPQIIKSTAANDIAYLFQLVNKASKLSFSIVFIIVLPVFIKTDEILTLWLGNVPDYTVTFTKLALVNAIIGTYSACLITLIQAIGRIKKFQICFSFLFLLSIPISYSLLKFGFSVDYVIFSLVVLEAFALCLRLITVKKQINFDVVIYLKQVILKTAPLAIVSILIAGKIDIYLFSGLFSLIVNILLYMSTTVLLFYFFCFNHVERKYLFNLFKR